LNSLDVMKEARGRNRALVKEFTDVRVGKDLVIELTPSSSQSLAAILCGVEVQSKGW
jgi:hypothetical protein